MTWVHSCLVYYVKAFNYVIRVKKDDNDVCVAIVSSGFSPNNVLIYYNDVNITHNRIKVERIFISFWLDFFTLVYRVFTRSVLEDSYSALSKCEI